MARTAAGVRGGIGEAWAKVLDTITVWLTVATSIGLIIVMLAMVADAIARKIFGSVPGALEASEALMAMVGFLPLGYVQMTRGHIEIDLVAVRFPTKIQVALKCVGASLGFACFGLLAVLSWDVAWSRMLAGEMKAGIIDFPVWPFRFFVPIGLGTFAAHLLHTASSEFSLAMRGE